MLMCLCLQLETLTFAYVVMHFAVLQVIIGINYYYLISIMVHLLRKYCTGMSIYRRRILLCTCRLSHCDVNMHTGGKAKNGQLLVKFLLIHVYDDTGRRFIYQKVQFFICFSMCASDNNTGVLH